MPERLYLQAGCGAFIGSTKRGMVLNSLSEFLDFELVLGLDH